MKKFRFRTASIGLSQHRDNRATILPAETAQRQANGLSGVAMRA
jgi:hypothetical protein